MNKQIKITGERVAIPINKKEKERTFLNRLPVDNQSGLLVECLPDGDIIIYGAYNERKKEYVIKEGFTPNEFALPFEMRNYIFRSNVKDLTIVY